MKKRMLQLRNQFFILGFGSLMIVSCSKEDLDDFFGKKDKVTNDTTAVDNGSNECLTCSKDTLIYTEDSTVIDENNNGGGSQQDSLTEKEIDNNSNGGNTTDTLSNVNVNVKDSL
jgi:hypothetical protein